MADNPTGRLQAEVEGVGNLIHQTIRLQKTNCI